MTLLVPCQAPDFTVQNWGDYPDYVARLHLALEKCSAAREIISGLLPAGHIPSQQNLSLN